MKTYIGTKIIEAAPEPKDGQDGYKVVYPDGYESWSPKDVFEAAYRDTENLDFGGALKLLKDGHKLARKGWNGKNMFIVMMPPLQLPPNNTQEPGAKVNDRTAKFIGEDTPLDCLPYLAMFTAQEQWLPGWLASQSDMLAEDWCLVS